MSLKHFYGFTGLLSAKATGLLNLAVALVIVPFGLFCALLEKVGISRKEEPFDWDDYEIWVSELETNAYKKEIRRKKDGVHHKSKKRLGGK